MAKVRRAVKRDPNRRAYMDTALTPVSDEEMDALEMFTATEAARGAADKAKRDLARTRAAGSAPLQRQPVAQA